MGSEQIGSLLSVERQVWRNSWVRSRPKADSGYIEMTSRELPLKHCCARNPTPIRNITSNTWRNVRKSLRGMSS